MAKRKTPKNRPPKGRRGKRVELSKIREMWEAYKESPSVNSVALKCSVAHATARKYIRVGDSSRGVKPFEQRMREVMRVVETRKDRQTADRMGRSIDAWRDQLDEAQELVDKYRGRLEEALDDDSETINRLGFGLKALFDALAQGAKVFETMQAMTKPEDERDRDQEYFAGWTLQEIKDFRENAIWPERIPVPSYLKVSPTVN